MNVPIYNTVEFFLNCTDLGGLTVSEAHLQKDQKMQANVLPFVNVPQNLLGLAVRYDLGKISVESCK